MKRGDREEQIGGKLFFHKTKVLKAGFLRMPEYAPNVLKNKGILAKAGDYFVSKPELNLTAMIHVLIRNKSHPENFRVTYREKYFLWTWTDSDEVKVIDNFLRVSPPGMCRHTQKQMQMARAAGGSASPDTEFYVEGICSRTECQMLKTEDLLATYLNASVSDEERHKRFVAMRQYKGLVEYSLVDPDDPRLSNGKLFVRGLKKRTLRYIGNSNGSPSNVFSLIYNTDSKLETFKNLMRPIMLNAKRASTQREFIIRQFAHEDSDTLLGWQKIIAGCLVGDDYNQNHIAAFANEKKIACREPKDGKPVDYSLKDRNVYNLALTRNPMSEAGKDYEKVTGFVYTNLEIGDLYKHILPLCNDITDVYKKRFDKYVMGTLGEDTGFNSFLALQSFADPPLQSNSQSAHYGYNRQTFLVRALKEDSINFKHWTVENLQDSFGFLHSSNPWMRKATELFNWLTLGDSKANGGSLSASVKSKLLSRKFILKKCFFSQEPVSEKMKTFTVVWHSIGDEKAFDEKPELKLGSAALTADLTQVLLHFETVENSKAAKVLGLSEKDYEDLLRYNVGRAKVFLHDIMKKAEHKSDLDKIPQLKMPIFNATQEFSHMEERLYDHLAQGTKEQLRMEVSRSINNILSSSLILQNWRPEMLRSVYLNMVDFLHHTLKDSKRLVVIKQGFKVFEKLMTLEKVYDIETYKEPSMKARYDWHNFAHFKFFDLVEYLVSCNCIDWFGFGVMRLAFKSVDSLISNPDVALTKITVDLISRFHDVLDRMQNEFKLEETMNRLEPEVFEAVKMEFSKLVEEYGLLKAKTFYWESVSQLQHREKNLSLLEKLLKVDLTPLSNHKKEKFAIEQVPVPYVTHGAKGVLKWEVARYSVEKGGFTVFVLDPSKLKSSKAEDVKNPTVSAWVNFQTFKDLPTHCPPWLSNVACVDTLYEQKKLKEATDIIQESKLWSMYKISSSEMPKVHYDEAMLKNEPSKSRVESLINKMLFSLKAGEDGLVQDYKKTAKHKDDLTWFISDPSSEKNYPGAHKILTRTAGDLLGYISYVKKAFDKTDDEKTKVYFNISANATTLFGGELLDKFPSLATNWSQSIVRDIEYGLRHVRDDTVFPKPRVLVEHMQRYEECVPNDALRFLFRPNDQYVYGMDKKEASEEKRSSPVLGVIAGSDGRNDVLLSSNAVPVPVV